MTAGTDEPCTSLALYQPQPRSLLFPTELEFELGPVEGGAPARRVKLEAGGAGTGSAAWAAGVLLAQFLVADPALARAARAQPAWRARPLAGATCVELGAGLGLVSLSAHLAGARAAVATDGEPTLLPTIRANVARNAAPAAGGGGGGGGALPPGVDVRALDWTDAAASAAIVAEHGAPDLVLAADVVYGHTDGHRAAHRALVDGLRRFARASSGGGEAGSRGALVLLAHTVRYASAEAGFWRRFDRVFERVAVDTHGVGAFGRAVDDADGAEADADARQGPTLWAALLRPEFLGDLDPECEGP